MSMSVVGSWRKRKRESCSVKQARRIVDRSRGTLICADADQPLLFGELGVGGGEGDSIDIFSFLFSKSRDFLITNDNRQVKADELRGKTVLLYMVSVTLHEPDSLLSETFHLREAYNELRPAGCFEVVLVPVDRGHALFQNQALDRFNALFSHMPWPAVPFYDKLACDRLEHAICGFPRPSQHSSWSIFDPAGNFVLKKWYPYEHFFTYYGGLELVPFTTDWLGKLNPTTCTIDPAIKGIINLDQLLSSPRRNFLLANDNTKVPISSLKGKVVGLYFCGCVPDPPRIEAIKKVYQQAMDLGHDFEILQINFHFHYYNYPRYTYIDTDLPLLKPRCKHNIPWLTLPFKDPCFRSLIRIFKCFHGVWKGDRLIIINPHELNINKAFLDFHGAEIIQHFGIEAYPFTRRRVFELELARRKREIKLGLIFNTPLLRYDQVVPISHLWGKRVLILFATHSECTAGSFVPFLKEKYLEQEREFEVVYISDDRDGSTFDECTKEMPWLVHPYSWEFAHMWRSKIFCTSGEVALASFHVDGELLTKKDRLEYVERKDYYISSYHREVEILKDYPFTTCLMEAEIMRDVAIDYKLESEFYLDILKIFKFRLDENFI